MNLLARVLGKPIVEAKSEDQSMPEDMQQTVFAHQEFKDAETWIFVDADGVVNVGIRDTPGQSPLLLCERNLVRCVQKVPCTGPSHIISSAANREIGHGDEGTYSKFATLAGSCDISEIFAERLAGIIKLAGSRCRMVLSSSWRKPHHQNRVLALEAAISKYSGTDFKFDDKTKLGGDEPEQRIQFIGDYIREHTQNKNPSDGPLRVVVLEDFAATHPKQWKFGGGCHSVDSTEEYWRYSSSQPHTAHVKLVHCYEEWVTDQGMQVQLGSGLTSAKVCEVERFLTNDQHCQMCRSEQNGKQNIAQI
jgi:hypothetical protein